MIGNEVAFFSAAIQNDPPDGVEEGNITARCQRHMNIGGLRGGSAARVEHDHGVTRIDAAVHLEALENDRMCIRHVASGNQVAVAPIKVVVAGWRPITAECSAIGGNSTCHTET